MTDNRTLEITALVDSGVASTSYIDSSFVERNQIPVVKTALPIPVYNADGTINKNGSIQGFVTIQLKIGNHTKIVRLAVTKLQTREIYLGYDWLKAHNPSIDWPTGLINFDHCPKLCGYIQAIL
jgi:hypothetical protein